MRLLYVDDSHDERELFELLVGQYGALVTSVGCAGEALEAVERIAPDILVSDIGLPDESGYELIRKVRQIDRRRGTHTPGVALTGWSQPADRDEALSAGYEEHLSKPVVVEKLLSVLEKLARQVRETRTLRASLEKKSARQAALAGGMREQRARVSAQREALEARAAKRTSGPPAVTGAARAFGAKLLAPAPVTVVRLSGEPRTAADGLTTWDFQVEAEGDVWVPASRPGGSWECVPKFVAVTVDTDPDGLVRSVYRTP